MVTKGKTERKVSIERFVGAHWTEIPPGASFERTCWKNSWE